MNNNLWMVGMDLNSAHPKSNMHPRPTLPAGAANPKKKRRTNTKAAARSQQTAECPPTVQLQNLRPPPLSCFGDTISVANPFDDMTPRSSQGLMQPCNLSQVHANAPQYMSGPVTRAMNPMGAMGGMRAMMPHNIGAMNQMGNHMTPMGGMSPISNSPVDRMSPMNNMGSHQSPRAMNQMGNHMNPMSGMTPMSYSTIGRTSPMNHMGLNQPPGTMNPMRNHMSPMGGMLPMGNSPGERMSPINTMSHQAPGSMHQIGNRMNSMAEMPPVSNSPSELNQQPGAMNLMRNHMNPMGGMPSINSTMGRISPINNMGAFMNQSHMGLPNNSMTGGAMGNSMGRPGASPLNGMPGNNQNHMANNGTMNGTPAINDLNGPIGPNGSPHHMGMNRHMNSSNLRRQMNGPMATMRSINPSNINVSGRNSNNMASMSHQNQMGIPMGSMPNDINGGLLMRHPMPMGHGFQPRPGMRLISPSVGKIYPPDQSMIFNSQNRNAPPIYLCGTCHKEVNDNDQGIVCESGCNFWFHRMCVGLTEAAFQLLTKEVYAEWVCDKCLKMKKVPPVKFRT